MTATGARVRATLFPSTRQLQLEPAEGWITVLLVVLMAFCVGLAIDDGRWVLGNDEYTNFLPWAGVAGAIVGLIGAKAGWHRWVAHLVSAVAASLVLPVVVGTYIVGRPASFVDLFQATARSAYLAWYDIAILNRPFTTEYGHYLLTLGILCWGTGQFASFAVFRHRRPLDAVIVVGLVLLANMSLTLNDELGLLNLLIAYSFFSLLLLARVHAFDEQTAWLRRRIGDPASVRSLYLRGGTVFVVLAVVGSLFLTSSASSAPLAGMWKDVPARLIEISQRIQQFLPAGGNTRIAGVTFGPQAVIRGIWQTNDQVAITAQVPKAVATRQFKWRAVVYDRFDGNSWTWSDPGTTDRTAEQGLVNGLADDPTPYGGTKVTIEVHRDGLVGPYILSPETPIKADHDATLTVDGPDAYSGAISLRDEPDDYAITALLPDYGDKDPEGLTQNRLRAAGTDYPDSVKALYLPPTTLGPHAAELLATIRAQAATVGDTPFDLAHTMESYLRSNDNFTYQTNVQDLPCGGIDAVECFATYRKGYCEYYASTMAVLLRAAGIPSRMVEGFLPGDRTSSGVETVRNTGAHAWVEAFFPGYGWVEFDPTGGPIVHGTEIPVGSAVPASAKPTVKPSPIGSNGNDRGEQIRPKSDPFGPTSGRPSPGAFIVIAILLAIVVGGLAFVAWRRGPRHAEPPDAVWSGVARLAGRFGFGPRPNQTIYEYAGALGDVLPIARSELQTVATAKVEVAYGRRVLDPDRLQALRDAHRRLRVALLRLAFRRKDRPKRR